MHRIDIVIPTCLDEVDQQTQNILSKTENCRVISTCLRVSSAINRNAALKSADSDIIVMMDDDMRGFYKGWLEDLITPLMEREDIILLSARIKHPQGVSQMGIRNPSLGELYIAENDRVCTACFALNRKLIMDNEISFDEQFIGSGYEDTDFMMQINKKFGKGRIWVNENVELIHDNKMKNQGGDYWRHNHEHYLSKWPDDESVKGQQDWT